MKKVVILFYPKDDKEKLNYPWVFLHLERMIRHLDLKLIFIDERMNEDYIDIVNKTKNDLLFAGVSAITGPQIVGGIKFTNTIKSCTGVSVIWGGWFPTVFPEMILNDGYADFICTGQGELPFKTFTERMLTGDDVTDIAGIGYKKNGNIYINPNIGLTDPFAFPEMDLTLIDANKLIDLHGKIEGGSRVFPYLATIGCPLNCSFCSVTNIYGSKWFNKKTEDIINDFRYLCAQAAINHVIFMDDNFFASKKFVLDFCNDLISSGLCITWEAEAHIGLFFKYFSDDDILLMKKSGLIRIRIGAESGDQTVQKLLNKKNQVDDTLKMIRILKKHHIYTMLFTMVCFPLDPDKDFFLTMNLIGKALLIEPQVKTRIKFFTPFPGTALYKLCLDNGFIHPTTTEKLINSFSSHTMFPWYKRDYHKDLDNFENFYFLFASPYYYKTFPIIKRPYMFVFNLFMYPVIYFRFRFNLIKFPIEAILFKRFIPFR